MGAGREAARLAFDECGAQPLTALRVPRAVLRRRRPCCSPTRQGSSRDTSTEGTSASFATLPPLLHSAQRSAVHATTRGRRPDRLTKNRSIAAAAEAVARWMPLRHGTSTSTSSRHTGSHRFARVDGCHVPVSAADGGGVQGVGEEACRRYQSLLIARASGNGRARMHAPPGRRAHKPSKPSPSAPCSDSTVTPVKSSVRSSVTTGMDGDDRNTDDACAALREVAGSRRGVGAPTSVSVLAASVMLCRMGSVVSSVKPEAQIMTQPSAVLVELRGERGGARGAAWRM